MANINSFKKYITIFKISWSRALVYRFNFLLGRLRNIIVLLLLYYVWTSLTYKTGVFAGYTDIELITYVFGINILRSIIFGTQTREIAGEIDSGELSKYLVMPVNYFWFSFCRELAQRLINLISAILEVLIFVFILKAKIALQVDFKILLFFSVSVVLAVFVYFIFSFLISLIAFWSREAMGPRFLYEWLLEFSSGAYFPLDILTIGVYQALSYLPFIFMIFFPISIYLGRFSSIQILQGIVWQIAWIIIGAILCKIAWEKGLKKYSGEGI